MIVPLSASGVSWRLRLIGVAYLLREAFLHPFVTSYIGVDRARQVIVVLRERKG